jgi:endo-alpha-N-acetylgalactosaminidase
MNKRFSVVLAGLILASTTVFAAETTIKSEAMEVTIDDAFPRVIEYRWLENGAIIYGQEEVLREVLINETSYTPKVDFKKKGKNKAYYELDFDALDVEIEIEISVVKGELLFEVIEIEENGDTPVKTLEFPNHGLIAVRDTQPGASLSTCTGVENDEFSAVSDAPPSKTRKSHAILNTDQLAATIDNNTILNRNQLWVQTAQKNGYKHARVWNNYWRYRYLDTEIVELPWARVMITPDINGDNLVNWQDGAIAFRNNMKPKFGGDKLRNSICYINMNFCSLAQNPFLRTLDKIKKFSGYIDGFAQMVELKGYGSEGHDSAHPDYAGNYNTRAGGLKDLNFLIEKAADYNTDIGFHINHTETYPEARSFSDELLKQPRRKAWAWLDQSYHIDRYADVISGNFYARLEQMKREVPNLAFLYVDTYGGKEWEAWKLSTKLHELDLYIWTEFAQNLDNAAIWTHQSWGSSRIARFIYNQERDVWSNDLLLKGGSSRNTVGHSGWQNTKDLHETLRVFYTNVLPNRYMMNFPIKTWTDSQVDFVGAEITAKDEGGVFNLYKDGRRIAQGNTMFIPWNPLKETKIYHWNDEGGTTTWQLPTSWKQPATVKLYKLTDIGRVAMDDLAITDGAVTIVAEEKTPYVVCKTAAESRKIAWSEGSPVKDMGFDSHGFTYWEKSSAHDSDSHIFTENNVYGDTVLKIVGNDGADAKLSQEMTGLVPGKSYAASVWVRSHGGRAAALRVGGKKAAIRNTDVLYTGENHKHRGTYFQRIKLYFVPARSTATIELLATSGGPDSFVHFDDVRVLEAVQPPSAKHLLFDDFETCDEGWGPFVYAPFGSGRTHLSELHEGYTDDTINGNWSLKSFSEGVAGEIIRTVPSTLRLAPKSRNTIRFKYTSDIDALYSVVVTSKQAGKEVLRKTLSASDKGTFSASFTTGNFYDYYVAFEKKKGKGVLVIDDFTIDGPAPKQLPPAIPAPADGSIPGYMVCSISATSEQAGGGSANTIDGSPATIWHTKYDLSDPLPQSITMEFEIPYEIEVLTYLPRQEGPNGIITACNILVSGDGKQFEQVATCTWAADSAQKKVSFDPVKARFIRLEATEGKGGWASAAEVKVYKKGAVTSK